MGVEATGSWYWLVDEIEAAGLVPHLAQPFAAKPMVGVGGKQTDSVDAGSNFYLRWAFVETANLAAARRKAHPQRHVGRLYERLRPGKRHQEAVVAVARHLAESAWSTFAKQHDYREPQPALAAVS